MSKNYPFLKDDQAVNQIRKHQWIESEKSGKELGFASAAVDWINKYGEKWLNKRLKSEKNKKKAN